MKETGWFKESRRTSVGEGQDMRGKGVGGVREKTAASTLLTWKVPKCPSYCLPSLADVRIGLVELRPATVVFVTTTHSSPHSHHEIH